METPIRGYELTGLLGEGGMGIVFRGRHPTGERDVAIKVMRGAAGERERELFHREVQAQARMYHPGIVSLIDYGVLSHELQWGALPVVERDSPFVAMELAPLGSVLDALTMSDWSTVDQVLQQVLEALAFSHARGVIHRDLKPGNLLVFSGLPELQVKLTDFGLAYAMGEEHRQEVQELQEVSGTPQYMAPEQIRGHWRSYGPWTDLYSVGCMAWEWVCGGPSFLGRTWVETMQHHLERPRPPLTPRFPVPAGLQAWIHQMMAIDRRRRYRCAADALGALAQLSAQDSLLLEHRLLEHRETSNDGCETSTPTIAMFTVVPDTLLVEPPSLLSNDGLIEPSEATEVPGTDDPRPPLPESWHPKITRHPRSNTLTAELGLFALREVPFVGRRRERDLIWKALRTVVAEGKSRLVVVSGGPGVGKSRLARWMARRAHETGAADYLRVEYSDRARGSSEVEGLGGMIQSVFRSWHLSRSKLYRHLLEQLPPLPDDHHRDADARALTELVYPTDPADDTLEDPRFEFSTPRQRFAVVTRLLQRLAQHRPLLVWIDDLQWGEEGLGLLEYLHESSELRRPDLPLLVLATFDKGVVFDPHLASRIDRIGTAAAHLLTLEALSGADHRELLDRLLPLDPDLKERLARRTEGNPLFAHQLLDQWIRADLLIRTSEGTLSVAQDPPVCDNIHQLWVQRLDGLLRISEDREELMEAL